MTPLLTSRRGLDRSELATTALAAVVSSTAYVVGGQDYLARGVVGDLAGFAVLGAVLAARGERLRHEALLCLALIGVTVALSPDWPLARSEAFWWVAFSVGLTAYVVPRQLRTR